MEITRRNAISLTATGLIHLAGHPESVAAEPTFSTELLVRQASQRGHTDLGWLKSYHSFSFGKYYDQRHMGFRSLRVINDDRIRPGRGFPTHPHRHMEIISYILEGSLQHRDSTGKGAIITPDDIQMMSAGTGITHSEFNPSRTEANHFLQIWIEPSTRRVRPRYSENKVTQDQKLNQWRKIVGPVDSKAAVSLYQDASIYATKLTVRKRLDYVVERGRHAWMHVARGEIVVNGTTLRAGDAIATSRSTALHAVATKTADVLLFDLA